MESGKTPIGLHGEKKKSNLSDQSAPFKDGLKQKTKQKKSWDCCFISVHEKRKKILSSNF